MAELEEDLAEARQSAREEEELDEELGPAGRDSPAVSVGGGGAAGGLPSWHAEMLAAEAAQLRAGKEARKAAAAAAAAAARAEEIGELEQALEMRRLELHFLSDQINQIAARQHHMQQAGEEGLPEEGDGEGGAGDDDDDAYVPFGAMSES